MTHRHLSSGTPLCDFSAHAGPEYQLLIRVVSVNDSGKVTLPIRELWCKVDGDAASGKLSFFLNSANTPDDDEEASLDTLDEANEAMRFWLRSLDPQFPQTGTWLVTRLVKAKPCIWDEVDSGIGRDYYKLHEKNLRTWLEHGKDGAEEFDDEEDWACVSCNSSDEEPSDNDDDDNNDNNEEKEEPAGFDEDDQNPDGDDDEEPSEPVDGDPTSTGVDEEKSSKLVDKVQILDSDDLDDDTEDGGVRLSPDQTKPVRRFNFTLVGCEAEATYEGYDGDA
jgi:hypothetical protein